LAFTAVMINTV